MPDDMLLTPREREEWNAARARAERMFREHRECTETCERCDYTGGRYDETWSQVRTSTDRFRQWCENCTHLNSARCEECGEQVAHHVAQYCERDDTYYCPDCDLPDTEPRALYEYHNGPRVSPLQDPKNPYPGRYFGVELEVEIVGGGVTGSHAEHVIERMDYVVGGIYSAERQAGLAARQHVRGEILSPWIMCERDGSLNHGFEIITIPLSIRDQRALWDGMLAPRQEWRRDLRSHNTSTCGLHVHVSRAGLTQAQICRAVVLLNHPDSAPLIRAVARRYDTGYSKVKAKSFATAHLDYERYELLNLCNSMTVEFRLFRGSLNRKAVLAAIEFANAILEYCADDMLGESPTAAGFLAWITNPTQAIHDDTANLRHYLTERGLTLPNPDSL